MKKTLALMLSIMCLLSTIGRAEKLDPLALVRRWGLEPTVSAGDDSSLFCCFSVLEEQQASVEWSNGKDRFEVQADASILARIYLLMLEGTDWDLALAAVNGVPLLSYGTDSPERFETLEQYAAQIRASFGLPADDDTAPEDVHTYVLNKKSRRFHLPDCPGIANMSDKNREEYTGTREELIDLGYRPCGTCDP